MSFLATGILIVALVPVFQIADLFLIGLNLGTQLLHKLLVTLAAGIHAIKRLPKSVYHIKQVLDSCLEAVYLIDIILPFNIQ